MNSRQLQWEDKYRKAVNAIQELLDFDKTILGANLVIRRKDRKVVLALDMYGTKLDNNVMQKVNGFIPDFILEEIMEDDK